MFVACKTTQVLHTPIPTLSGQEFGQKIVEKLCLTTSGIYPCAASSLSAGSLPLLGIMWMDHTKAVIKRICL